MIKLVASNVFTKSIQEMNAPELLLKTVKGLGNGWIPFNEIFTKFRTAAKQIERDNGLTLYETCFCPGIVRESLCKTFVEISRPKGAVNRKCLSKVGYVLKSKKDVNGYLFKLVRVAVNPTNLIQLGRSLHTPSAQNDNQSQLVSLRISQEVSNAA